MNYYLSMYHASKAAGRSEEYYKCGSLNAIILVRPGIALWATFYPGNTQAKTGAELIDNYLAKFQSLEAIIIFKT